MQQGYYPVPTDELMNDVDGSGQMYTGATG
jgi:hypothetical protein